ncbi:hypothetical protein FQN53_003446 [Emmonsiellopsis sp. PD_33]|nr:hypothetical protein FQN53_003446 [Emmonsiellopsis sp. PD_33]
MAANNTMKTSIPSIHAASLALANQQQQQHDQQKQQKQPANTSQRKPAPDPRHLAIALHHAHQIQARKDTESLILTHIESLVDYPTNPLSTASAPTPSDVKAFKQALLPFQPSDYDNLILERNIEGRCGYVLCANEHRREDPNAKFRVVWGKKGTGPGGRGREMRVVPKEDLEKWCSDECAKRAMYVRVQLVEQPAWERGGGVREGPEILLLEEGRARREMRDRARAGGEGEGKGKQRMEQAEMEEGIEETMRRMAIGDKSLDPDALAGELGQLGMRDTNQEMRAGQAALAMERGDAAPKRGLDAGRVGVINIFEKQPGSSSSVVAPVLRPGDEQGGSIEGFEPSDLRDSNQEAMDEDEDDDILATI